MSPSVTQILEGVGLIDASFFTEESAQRGKDVHRICQLYDEGDLDYSTVDPKYDGYLLAYQNFLSGASRQATYKWERIETPGESRYGYHGTYDRMIISKPAVLLDIKTGGSQRWHALQTAAYVYLLPKPYRFERLCLYLRPDGTYTTKRYSRLDLRNDWSIFLSALNLYRWKEQR